YLYYKLKKYSLAIQNFKFVTAGYWHPATLYWQAKTYKRIKQQEKSLKTFYLLQEKYPLSFYSYRFWQVSQRKPTVNAQEIYPQLGPVNLPERLKLLLQSNTYDDAFYELKTFYSENSLFWANFLYHMYQNKEYYYQIRGSRYFKKLIYQYPLGYYDLVKISANINHLDKYLILAVMREESHFRPDVRSWAGANGLMQLMGFTARATAKKLKIRRYDILDPYFNVAAGSFYLRSMTKAFGQVKGVAAYNCGPGNVSRFAKKKDLDEYIEDIPLIETRNYVKKVLGSYWAYQLIYKKDFN
ncbi:lytic transglycosylase domain-containing protein, partial [bacterium]|nr:lytic transglycosylase domain-containing protein [bacterium]